MNYNFNDRNWKNHIWWAWDSNSGRRMVGPDESTELWRPKKITRILWQIGHWNNMGSTRLVGKDTMHIQFGVNKNGNVTNANLGILEIYSGKLPNCVWTVSKSNLRSSVTSKFQIIRYHKQGNCAWPKFQIKSVKLLYRWSIVKKFVVLTP